MPENFVCNRCHAVSPAEYTHCAGCGREISSPEDQAAPVPAAPVAREPIARAPVRGPVAPVYGARTGPLEPLFLHISVTRLILLSIASAGLYEAYWIYKNWNYIKEREGLGIHPFWRGFFGVFFCHSLLKRIKEDEDARALIEPSFSVQLATGWSILFLLADVIGRAPGTAPIIIAAVMPSYLFLVPVQSYINSVTEKRSPGASYYGWSGGHNVCLVVGLMAWASVFFFLM